MLRKFYSISALAMLATLGSKAQQTVENVVFPKQSVWKYLDNGTDQSNAWFGLSYNDSAWASGVAELGYGDGDEATVVNWVDINGGKNPCTYFRTKFNLTSLPTANQRVALKLKRDDGAIVYINGIEAVRDNMPAGPVTHETYALATVD